jgi:hypothetical protein
VITKTGMTSVIINFDINNTYIYTVDGERFSRTTDSKPMEHSMLLDVYVHVNFRPSLFSKAFVKLSFQNSMSLIVILSSSMWMLYGFRFILCREDSCNSS